MATSLGPQCSKQIFERKNIQDGNPGNNSDFPATGGMGDIAGFQRRLFPHSSPCEVPEIPQVPFPKSVLSVPGSSLWPLHGVHLCGLSMEFTCVVKEVKLMAQSRGIRIHQYLDDWLIRAPTKESCHQGTQSLLALCQELGWIINVQKSELEAKQIFEFVGYKYDLSQGLVLPTQNRWESILQKLESILSKPSCRVRNFMSLIGLLTATEKQVPLGRLHMRPIQWHLKRHWRVPESLEKEIPVPRSLHPHLLWWTKETNVLTGQPLHPLSRAVQIFTDASKEGWGAHLGDVTARGDWSVPESHLHINFLELKAVLLALKRFQSLVQGKVVLVATDNTTVVAYINKEGGMRSGSLCALLWRLLCGCNLRQVVLRARHIPGRLNVIADKLSRQGQVIQTEWSLHQEVFDLLTQTWHRPQVDMFATKYNCKLDQYVSPVPDPRAWAVDALTVSWENLDMYIFPPSIVAGQGGQQTVGPSLQESDPNSSGLAQHAMVLGPGGTVGSDPSLPTQPSRPSDTAIQQGTSQKSDQTTRLAPRAEAIKEQGFSSPVASRIEAPQRSSTRTVYEAKWAVFVRWCESSQVDFRSPSVKQIADFLLHLFQEKNLQPSTIDGYRSAIADKLGNSSLNVSKDENLTRLLDSFHRDRPKGRRGIPSAYKSPI